MAVVAPSSPGGLDPKPDNAPATSQDPSSLPPPAPSDPTAPPAAAESAAGPKNPNPNPIAPPRPPSLPSFRPLGAPPLPHFPHLPNPNLANPPYQVPGLQPPGVSPPGVYAPGPYMAPNGYMGVPPPGVHRYPAPPYHPGYPLPPGAPIGAGPQIHRPPIPGIRGISPLIPTITRPAVPFIPPAEKPQTTVYVGKIASTVGNDFIESVLRLCGPVKSWKRAENPSDGTFRGFGFCEFESAEGVLRALRLLNKFNIDGQDLVLNVNQATREYLERYVEKKKEREKLKEAEEDASQSGSEKQESSKPSEEKPGPNEEPDDKDKEEIAKKFGIVCDEDRDADKDALDKLTNMIHERIKSKPPPPPPLPSDISAEGLKSISEPVDVIKPDLAGGKDEEMMGDTRDHDRHEASPFERTRRSERSVERDREKDVKRENERDIERVERGRERERLRREREREMRIRESERLYKELLKDWEAREREKETLRQREVEREKERARERRREVKDQEVESDEEDTRKRRRRSSMLEEKRRKRQREKEEDMADVLHEEEEIREAKKREEEEQKRKEETKLANVENGANDRISVQDHPMNISVNEESLHAGEETLVSVDHAEPKQESNVPSRKLGFGLMPSGKRAAVLPVFHQEDENVEEKKMRPLIPIDYSAEEMQAASPAVSDAPPHLAAAAEFAKRISGKKDARREKEEEEKRKLLDAKQLIDMIPKTKDKLFSYQINWEIYDKHGLHERMRPWISKKITEFLGEEETTLVDYIVSSTMEHVRASEMLEMLQSILDDEAEMFVLKMWRMLIFEIKKVETGLALK